MRRRRSVWRVGVVAALAVVQTGCTFLAWSGGGPLTRAELGDWAGIVPEPAPPARDLDTLVRELKGVRSNTFAGRYSIAGNASVFALNCLAVFRVPFTPAPGLMIKGRMSPWLRVLPGQSSGDWLFCDPADSSARQIYAMETDWNYFLGGGNQVDAYDVATRQRVAARRTDEVVGLGLGWTRVRRVLPVDELDDPRLNAVKRTRVVLDDVRYELKDENILFLGIAGWGRVNRRRYLQLLWIPIDLGSVEP